MALSKYVEVVHKLSLPFRETKFLLMWWLDFSWFIFCVDLRNVPHPMADNI